MVYIYLVDFSKTVILHKEPFYYKRIIKESIEICKHRNNFNKDNGTYNLSNIWKTVVVACCGRVKENDVSS